MLAKCKKVIKQKLIRAPGQAEAKIVVAAVWLEPAAKRRTAVPGVVVPAAATADAAGAT